MERRRSLLILAAVSCLTLACDPPAGHELKQGATPPAATAAAEPSPAPLPVATDGKDPKARALEYCRHTQGPVPHWLLYEDILPLVVERERAVLRNLGSDTSEAMGNHLPHQRAVMGFVRRRIQCEVVASRADGDDTIAFALLQKVPLIIEPKEKLDLPPDLSDADRELRWLEAFDRAFEGKFNDAQIALRLERGKDGLWYVDPQVDARFGAPRRANKALSAGERAIRSRDWTVAESEIRKGCEATPEDTRCERLLGVADKAAKHKAAVAPVLRSVKLRDSELTGLVSSGRTIPVLSVSVENTAKHEVSSVWVRVTPDTGKPTVCHLTAEKPPSDATLLGLSPGTTSPGFCRLPVRFTGPIKALEVVDLLAPDLTEDPAPRLRKTPPPELQHQH